MFVRVYSGAVKPGDNVLDSTKGKKERIGKIFQMHADKENPVDAAEAGNIYTFVGLKNVSTGDTLCAEGKEIVLEKIEFAKPVIDVAIEPKTKAEQDKMSLALTKLAEEDPTFQVSTNHETGQTIISAVGEAQVSVLLNRLEDRTKVAAKSVPIRIPYRETIRRTASAQGRHKKQTGGAGQYGDCWLRVEPLIGPDGTSDGYEFVDEVVGGRIPRSLIPAVDKGVQETMKDGIIAGYPLTGIRVAVYDGSYHSVDSNEMAFRAAARIGLRKACADADPVVLEPIEEITVTIPESYAGAVMGDISASRGRVTGMETDERGDTVVIAQAPLAELTDYSTRLRSITRGTGDFTMKPAGYEQVPYDVQAKLVERYEEGRAK